MGQNFIAGTAARVTIGGSVVLHGCDYRIDQARRKSGGRPVDPPAGENRKARRALIAQQRHGGR